MKRTLCLLLSVLLVLGTVPFAFALEYPEVTVTAQKDLLTAEDMTSDGMYVFKLGAQVTGTENTEGLTYSWTYREKGVTAWWDNCPDAAVHGSELIMPISPDRLNVYKGVEFSCTVSGDGIASARGEFVTVCAAPFFTTDLPERITVKEEELNDETCTLCAQVIASGFGKLTYAWELSENDGESWTVCEENFGELTLELPSARFTDGKTLLRCSVTDEHDNTTVSSPAKLGFSAAPVITQDLPESYIYKAKEFNADKQLYSGHEFSILASGEELSYEWYLSFDNGESWEQADCSADSFSPEIKAEVFAKSSAVLIKAAAVTPIGSAAFSGVCRCTFTPVITSDLPANIYVDADDIVTVNGIDHYRVNASIEAQGCSELTCKWYYSDLSVPGSPYKEFDNASSTSLENALIPKEAVLWTSHIYCEVFDEDGASAASSNAKVVYIHKAEVRLPETLKVTGAELVNGEYECRLTAKGFSREKAKITYQWFERYGDSEWFAVGDDTAEFSKTYTEAELLTNISIKCTATVYSRFTTESNECKIEVAPCFTQQPKASDVSYGETGTISAGAISTEEITYMWLRSTDDYHWFILADNEQYSGTNTDTLTVKNVRETEYSTLYRCRAVAGDDIVTSKKTKFAKPEIRITKQPSDTEAAVGKAAVFRIEAEGIGLTYQWTCCDYSSYSWKIPGKNPDFDAYFSDTGALTVNVKSELAYTYMFRCTVSDGEKEVYSGSVRILSSAEGGDEPFAPKVLLRGDVDLNGKVQAADARLALRASVGLEKYEKGSDSFLTADWNSDGRISADDARSILRKAVGLS